MTDYIVLPTESYSYETFKANVDEDTSVDFPSYSYFFRKFMENRKTYKEALFNSGVVICIKRISDRGEIVIPQSIRKEKGLEANTKVEIIPTKDGILLVPLTRKMSELAGLFGTKGVKNIKELDAITHELLGM